MVRTPFGQRLIVVRDLERRGARGKGQGDLLLCQTENIDGDDEILGLEGF